MVLGSAVTPVVAEFGSVTELPVEARALFGAGLFSSLTWYAAVEAACVPAGGTPAFLVIGQPVMAVVPMLRLGAGAASLTTPYTCLWSLLTAPGLDAVGLDAVGRALGRWCRAWATVRLDAMDGVDVRWGHVLRGVRRAGLVALRFDHFGNWRQNVAGLSWDDYLAARPGALRSTYKRRGARLAAGGAVFRVMEGGAALEGGIAAFESVYALSWKEAEPFPCFNATLMRVAGSAGLLRLGLLEREGRAIAAQLWIVADGCATVLKLAYDEAVRGESAGTVLTGQMIAYLMARDRPAVLDFGRGDDEYKADWVGVRQQRIGVLLANYSSVGGLVAIARHAAGRVRRKRKAVLF